MASSSIRAADGVASQPIVAGTVLVSPSGVVKVVRSRTAADDGWNCSEGAPIDDTDAENSALWQAYTPEQLLADLSLARELRGLSGQRELSGGLATWDACSGRPCVLPKLAKLDL